MSRRSEYALVEINVVCRKKNLWNSGRHISLWWGSVVVLWCGLMSLLYFFSVVEMFFSHWQNGFNVAGWIRSCCRKGRLYTLRGDLFDRERGTMVYRYGLQVKIALVVLHNVNGLLRK